MFDIKSYSEAENTGINSGIKVTGVLCLLFMFIISGSGCNDNVTGSNDNDNGDNGPSDVVEVGMTASSFTPANIEIEVGTTVIWTNNSSEAHSVTSGTNGDHDGQFNSGNLPPGEEFSYEFTETGVFDYFCIPHWQMGMVGTVTVVEGS